jgi:hypothetical protein
VESYLLLGCSHKIPNGTSSAFDLSRRSIATYNTILGLSLQGPSWHVLPPCCTWILRWAWVYRSLEFS